MPTALNECSAWIGNALGIFRLEAPIAVSVDFRANEILWRLKQIQNAGEYLK
jgi:hypothetical protein